MNGKILFFNIIEGPYTHVESWLKDSTWTYFSQSGDITKIVRYKDGRQVK